MIDLALLGAPFDSYCRGEGRAPLLTELRDHGPQPLGPLACLVKVRSNPASNPSTQSVESSAADPSVLMNAALRALSGQPTTCRATVDAQVRELVRDELHNSTQLK